MSCTIVSKINQRSIGALVLQTLIASLIGCGGGVPAETPQTVMFDKASKKAIVAPAATEYPAIHPQTGAPTLLPAMYCAKCDAWRPVPPPEEVNHMQVELKCSKCRGALATSGPFPE